jgi:luciferase family oxidoreductase group 1
LARHVEALGYERFWIAEHHNLEGIASAATVVLMGDIAGHTQRIRVGSGGIMLPNHAPFIVAEQIGTLEALYPGRIDLGLGRAPGTDPLTMRALRRHSTGADFDADVAELVGFLRPRTRPGGEGHPRRGHQRAGVDPRVEPLQRAPGRRHRQAVCLSHRTFAPGDLLEAIEIYRREFRPSRARASARDGGRAVRRGRERRGSAVPLDDDDPAIARHPARAPQRAAAAGRRRSRPSPAERAALAERMALFVVGGPARVAEGFQQILEATQADELILVSETYDRAARLESFRIAASLRTRMRRARAHDEEALRESLEEGEHRAHAALVVLSSLGRQ